MKNLVYIASVLLLVSCTPESETTEMKERSIGFATAMDDAKFHLGTEAAINVVKEFDKHWAAKNYEGMRALLVDTASFFFSDGRVIKSADEALEAIKEDMSSDPSWTFDYAFSVDLDPTQGGEHVQAGFTVKSSEEGVEKESIYHESYYVIEGKIVWYTSYKLDVKKEM